MENVNFILCIVYLILAILNIFQVIKIENSSAFGMTVGALFLCLAPLFDKKIIRVIFYIFASGLILGFDLLKNANEIIKDVDENTWLLLSLSITFLANFLGKVNSDKINEEKRTEQLNKKSENIQELQKIIKEMKEHNSSNNDEE